jgi:hypothetical protein
VTGLQIYLLDQNGNPIPYGELQHLAATVGVDTGDHLSPLLTGINSRQWTTSQPKPRVSSLGTHYDCWYIRFMPDGSTTLPAGQQWYVTLHEAAAGNGGAKLPPNYAVLSVNPISGKLSLYRP